LASHMGSAPNPSSLLKLPGFFSTFTHLETPTSEVISRKISLVLPSGKLT
jgi:hypothetical protein